MKEDVWSFISGKIKEFDVRVRNSFVLIRRDIDEIGKVVEAMKSYLREKEKKFEDAWKREDGLRKKFQRHVDEFSEKISQLRLALSAVRNLKEGVVTVKDVARIEEEIKTSFRNEIAGYREEVRYLKELMKEKEKRIKALEKETEKNNGNGKRFSKFWRRNQREEK